MRARPVLLMFLIASLLLGALPPGTGSAASSRARTRHEVVPGTDIAGSPDELDRMPMIRHWFGSRAPGEPRAVLVLVPGFFGASQTFDYVAERLVTRMPSLQVWAVERRNNLLENICGMEEAQNLSNPQIAAAYYLSGLPILGCPSPAGDPDAASWDGLEEEFSLSQDEAAAVGMDRWGLATELLDIREVVRAARREYPNARVFLGGHSLGGMTAQLYAAWRFGQKPRSAGWRSIDGIVLIDGAVNGHEWEEVMVPLYGERRQLVDDGVLYWEDLASGFSPLIGYLGEIGGMAASLDPVEESFIWTSLQPPIAWPDPATCPTNKAVFAALTDDSHAFSGTVEMKQGEVSEPVDSDGNGQPDACAAPNGTRSLVHWVDFDASEPPELSSTDVWAASLWENRHTNGVEWYFSIVLNADVDIASNLDSTIAFTDPRTAAQTTAAQNEGHRVLDNARVAVPVYGFISAECRERFDWYRSVATSVPSFRYVDRSYVSCAQPATEPHAHLDPLFAFDEAGFTNDLAATLVRWLKRQT